MSTPSARNAGRPVIVRTYQEGFAALDSMLHAVRHLAAEFRMDMTREQAMVNMESRRLLMECYLDLLEEMEIDYKRGLVIQ